MKKFTVEAARTTGEWIAEPKMVGEVEKAAWDKMTDTDDVHFDTFERYEKDEQGNEPVTGETCAIEVTWVD